MIVKDARRIGVYGRSGSGKSTCVKALIKGLSRLVVFDPLGEYSGRGKGFTHVTSQRQLMAAIKAGWQRGFRLAYEPPSGAEAAALDDLARLLIAFQMPYKRGIAIPKVTLVAEELNLGFGHGLPREFTAFAELCSRGRHYGIELIGVTQRLAEVQPRFRGNTTCAYFFAQDDFRDIQTIAAMLGPDGKAAVMGLQDHEYIRREAGTLTRGKNRLGR